jgi:hypothetical protein
MHRSRRPSTFRLATAFQVTKSPRSRRKSPAGKGGARISWERALVNGALRGLVWTRSPNASMARRAVADLVVRSTRRNSLFSLAQEIR